LNDSLSSSPDWVVYNSSNSGLPNNNIFFINRDTGKNKWIGTQGGLAKYDGNRWIIYTSMNSGLPSNGIGSFAIDKSRING